MLDILFLGRKDKLFFKNLIYKTLNKCKNEKLTEVVVFLIFTKVSASLLIDVVNEIYLQENLYFFR